MLHNNQYKRRVYFAGKIYKGDWRTAIVQNNRKGQSSKNHQVRLTGMEFDEAPEHDTCDCSENDLRAIEALRYGTITLDNGIIYAGPFFVGCDHGCFHGTNTHGSVLAGRWGQDISDRSEARRIVFGNALYGIQHADAVFAFIDSADAHGTLTEIGLAFGLDIPIYIGFKTEDLKNNMWFADHMATKSIVSSSPLKAYDYLMLGS